MSTTDFDLHAQLRPETGTAAVRRLRGAGRVPGVIYGAAGEAVAIALSQQELGRHMEQESFYSHVLNLHLEGRTEQVVLRAVQYHPVRAQVLHIDLQRIRQDAAIRMTIPLHFVGEDVAPGVREQSGIISHLLTEVEVSCLPKNLPEYLEVDLSGLHVGELIHLSELKIPEGVELTELLHEHDPGVVTINVRREIVEPEETAAEDAEAAGAEEGAEKKDQESSAEES